MLHMFTDSSETDLPCESSPCRNGATCTNIILDDLVYECKCADEWTGLTCETGSNYQNNLFKMNYLLNNIIHN